jgi:hypothetical protein
MNSKRSDDVGNKFAINRGVFQFTDEYLHYQIISSTPTQIDISEVNLLQFRHVLIIFVLLLIPHTASAYLDPGTASILYQMLIATFLGVGFAVKIYWMKIKSFFGKKTSDENK